MVNLIYTERAERDFSKEYKMKIEKVISMFPELENMKIIIGFQEGNWNGGSCDVSGNNIVKLKPEGSYFLIGHELTHLVQSVDLIPTGEATCDMFTIARSELFLDERPYYLETYGLDAQTLRSLCFQATNMKFDNKRGYFYWYRSEAKKLKEAKKESEGK